MSDKERIRELIQAARREFDEPEILEDLKLPIRTYNRLRREGIETIADLTSWTEAELMSLDQFGIKMLEDVRETLVTHSLALSAKGRGQAVYLLEVDVYEQRRIVGVFSTAELAMAAWSPKKPRYAKSDDSYEWAYDKTHNSWYFGADMGDAAGIEPYVIDGEI